MAQTDILDIIKNVRKLGNTPALSTEQELALTVLCNAEMELEGLMPWSSNYTFLVQLSNTQVSARAIYKPGEGERPLWDFPSKTLHKREFLSYLLSQSLGWPSIPATVLRDGPHGVGSVQLFIDADYEVHYFTLRDNVTLDDTFREVALFDLIANNADRKAGHCLQDKQGHIWAIDHGLTFHDEFKLRTVIHEVCNESIPKSLQEDVTHLYKLLCQSTEFVDILKEYITVKEIEALKQRVKALLSQGHYPHLSPYNVPYPPV